MGAGIPRSGGVKPRVVHVTTVDMSVRHLLLNQLLALQRAGFEVAAMSAPGPDIAAVEAAGIRHLPVPFTRTVSPMADLASAWRLWRTFRRERFTIVHTHQAKAALFGQLAARLAGVPIVVNTIHGFYFHERTPRLKRRVWILAERFAARCSSWLLSQNREDIETAVAEGICTRDRISHLGNGIDVRRFDPAAMAPARVAALAAELGFPADAVVVGFVGRLVREKGLLELFDAIASLRRDHPRLRLLVVGPQDTDKADALAPATAAEHGIGDISVFTGYRHDMPELYSLMRVCVLPSHREGMPRSPMEASAMGVPCVATNIRGCREVVRDGDNGWLVPVGDAGAIAQAVHRVLSDEAAARAMSARARARALQEFDEQIVFGRVCQAYTRLLKEAGLPAPSESGALQPSC